MNLHNLLMTLPLLPIAFIFFVWMRDQHNLDKARMKRQDEELERVIRQAEGNE